MSPAVASMTASADNKDMAWQRRGLYQTDYRGVTLRENLGLPRPKVGAWKVSRAAVS
jgi:hypothetical protein